MPMNSPVLLSDKPVAIDVSKWPKLRNELSKKSLSTKKSFSQKRFRLNLKLKALLAVVGIQGLLILVLCFVILQSTVNVLNANGLASESLSAQMQAVLVPNVALVVGLALVLVSLLAIAFAQHLSEKLETLRQGTMTVSAAVTDGHFNESSRIPVNSDDELGELTIAFNKLIDNLELEFSQKDQFEDMLQNFNHQLEEKVKVRTQELEQKNQVLNKINNELHTAQRQLLHAEKMASVGQLAAGVAHEINNPVGYVLSNVKTLEDYIRSLKTVIASSAKAVQTSDELSPHFEAIMADNDVEFICEDIDSLLNESEQGLQRVQEIVMGLKSFSHMDSDKMRPSDVNECIRNTLSMVNNQLKYHCKVYTNLCDEAIINCHTGRLSQVFTNLLVNAGQAIKEDGIIKVHSVRDGEKLKIYIVDNGAGIPEDNLKKLFDPFFTTKSEGEGTGLGLSISYGIIKEHGGNIEVKSVRGKGTCFIVSLPL